MVPVTTRASRLDPSALARTFRLAFPVSFTKPFAQPFLIIYLTLIHSPIAAEYAKIRAADEKKKAENYQKNVQKAFKFEDFTSFYLKRGTSEGGSWLNAPAKGHRMAKTKYDYSGAKVEDNKLPEAFSFGKKK